MGTYAALACFAFVLLAMNFDTYFAKMSPEEVLKAMCGDKAGVEAFDFCHKEKASPLKKELYSLCAKNVGIKGGYSMKSLLEVSCVKGGEKTFTQFYDCFRKEVSQRKMTKEIWAKQMQPFKDCIKEKAAAKPE